MLFINDCDESSNILFDDYKHYLFNKSYTMVNDSVFKYNIFYFSYLRMFFTFPTLTNKEIDIELCENDRHSDIKKNQIKTFYCLNFVTNI